jgi:hypothetical protein
MVYYSANAQNDLIEIFWGLMTWEKHPLEYNHATAYLDDIYEVCNKLDKISYHTNTQYQLHKQYGNKVYKYRRNKNTTWYIIYEYDIVNNVVLIKHIIPNHTTTGDI